MSYPTRLTLLISVLVLIVGLPITLFANTYKSECDVTLKDLQNKKSIDKNIQALAKKHLDKSIVETKAAHAEYVLLDASNGKVISTYNTGDPSGCSVTKWEPGSVVKPLTVAAALNEGAINKDFTFFDTGNINVSGRQISNWADFAKETKNLETLLGDSLNIGSIAVFKSLVDKSSRENKHDVWLSYLTAKYELLRAQPNQKSYPAINSNDLNYRSAISSFGLGIVTTPTQLSLAYASILNGGMYHKACYDAVCEPHGEKVLSAEVSMTIKNLLTKIYAANRPSQLVQEYSVGGKTGSSPLALPDGTYIQNRETGTFIGYVSIGAKTYIQLVRLDMPKNHPLVSSSAKEVWGGIVVGLAGSSLL